MPNRLNDFVFNASFGDIQIYFEICCFLSRFSCYLLDCDCLLKYVSIIILIYKANLSDILRFYDELYSHMLSSICI